MCGISGILNFNSLPVDRTSLGNMIHSMKHRGPDHEEMYFSGNLGLAHRRLSINDLSPRGNQPLFNENKSLVLVCNGEIYNAPSLRQELEQKGHTFFSNSDNEVILHAYEEWGIELHARLDGMWAFALWDNKAQKLILSRDRIGKRPLIYYADQKQFLFSSEINALMNSKLIKKNINLKALDSFLTFQYIPHPDSIYERVYKLPPAHYLIVEKGTLNLSSFWNFQFLPKTKWNEEDLIEYLDEKIHDAVKKRLLSDVPIGAFLSGGLDSSLVVAIASRHYPFPLKTFSVGYEEKNFSELKYAKIIADLYGTEHHEIILRPDIQKDLFPILKNYGEPYADSSAIPSYYVAQAASQKVKVVLNGDGGDELFAGYNRYFFNPLSILYQKLPSFCKNISKQIFHLLPEGSFPVSYSNRIRHRFDCHLDSLPKRFYQDGFYQKALKKELCLYDRPDNVDAISDLFIRTNRGKCEDICDKLLNFDFKTYLTDDLMVKIDIACMSHSLETRSPLLDADLFSILNHLPFRQRAKNRKELLKKLVLQKKYLPPEIVFRKKMGFGIPIGEWMKNELRTFLIDDILLSSPSLEQFFNKELIRQMINEHHSGAYNHGTRLWSLIAFMVWHHQNME